MLSLGLVCGAQAQRTGDGVRGPDRPGGGSPERPRGGPGVGIPGVFIGPGGPQSEPPRETREPKQRTAKPPPRRAPPRTVLPAAANRIDIPPASETRLLPDEVVLEFAAGETTQAVEALAARHSLEILESADFALTNTIMVRARIADGRPVRQALAQLASETSLRTAQPNYLYAFVQEGAGERNANFQPPEPARPEATPVAAAAGALPLAGDPTQYAWRTMRLPEAHRIARGENVLVAVIDSGVDVEHPDLRDGIAGSLDALKSPERAHSHGTAIAGAIVSRAQMTGVAPAARILAIRAFSTSYGFTFAIIRGIEHAAAQNARIINMSFAGPADPATLRHLAAAHDRGLVLVAAAGNLGPKAPPQYPAAAPNVIAVSATDANDRLYTMANRGRYIALSAPGVNLRLPAPDGGYQTTSGTSFATAYVSGIAALILERRPSLAPDEVRAILLGSVKDLGPKGRDDLYGAGRVDAWRAVSGTARP